MKWGISMTAIGLFVSVFVASSALSYSSAQSSRSIELFPVNSKPFGISYEEHIMNYWKFILPINKTENPAEDLKGDRCTQGQNVSDSSIFYLHANGGGDSEKTCIMPAGKGLFIPILQAEDSTAEEPGATVADLRKAVMDDQDRTRMLTLSINDTIGINNIKYGFDDLVKYRITTRDFPVVFAKDPIFPAIPGPATAVADGTHVITTPLAPGNYTVQFYGTTTCYGVEEPGCTNFQSNNIYHLIVR